MQVSDSPSPKYSRLSGPLLSMKLKNEAIPGIFTPKCLADMQRTPRSPQHEGHATSRNGDTLDLLDIDPMYLISTPVIQTTTQTMGWSCDRNLFFVHLRIVIL